MSRQQNTDPLVPASVTESVLESNSNIIHMDTMINQSEKNSNTVPTDVISGKSVGEVEFVPVFDEIPLVKNGMELQARLEKDFADRASSKKEFLEFLLKNQDTIGYLKPTHTGNPFMSADDLWLSADGLRTALETIGTGKAALIDGWGDRAIAFDGIAIYHDFEALTLDFDFLRWTMNPRLAQWVDRYRSYALQTQGNPTRLGLTFRAPIHKFYRPDAQDLTNGKEKTERFFGDDKLEIIVGEFHKTIFGKHKSNCDYKLVLPAFDVWEPLPYEAFNELLFILEQTSRKVDKSGDSGEVERKTFDDLGEDINKRIALLQYVCGSILKFNPDYSLEVEEFLNTATKGVLMGQKRISSSSFAVENVPNGERKPIGEGYRNATYVNSGEDIRLVIQILREIGLPASHRMIDGFLDRLLELTDLSGEKEKSLWKYFHQKTNVKKDYLWGLITRIGERLTNDLEEAYSSNSDANTGEIKELSEEMKAALEETPQPPDDYDFGYFLEETRLKDLEVLEKAKEAFGNKSVDLSEIRAELVAAIKSDMLGSELEICLLGISQKYKSKLSEIKELFETIKLEEASIPDDSNLEKSLNDLIKSSNDDINLEDFIYPELAINLSRLSKELGYSNLSAISFLLSASASLCPIGTQITPWHKFIEPSIIWTSVIALSGAKKSVIRRVFTEIIEILSKKAYKRFKKEKKKAKASPPANGVMPIQRIYWTTDPTTEALLKIQSDQQDLQKYESDEIVNAGILVDCDELSGFFAGMDLYRGGKGSDVELYLKLYSGSAISQNRKNEDSSACVYKNGVCIIGTTQNSTFLDLLNNYGKGGQDPKGFFARFMWVVNKGEPCSAYEIQNKGDSVTRELCRLYRRILHTKPKIYKLDTGAWNRFAKWYDFVNKKTRDDESMLPGMVTFWGKTQGLALRIALVLHIINATNCKPVIDVALGGLSERSSDLEITKWIESADNDEEGLYLDDIVLNDFEEIPGEISDDTMKKAIQLTILYINQASAMYSLSRVTNMDKHELKEALASGSEELTPLHLKIYERAIRAKEKGITARDILRAGVGGENVKKAGTDFVSGLFATLSHLGKGEVIKVKQSKIFYATEFIPK